MCGAACAASTGQADMYNLTVANDHTFVVGTGEYVVHNCNGRDPQLQQMAQDLYGTLNTEGADVSHLTVGVGKRSDGALFVALNERIPTLAGQELKDGAAVTLQKMLQTPEWADKGLQYVGPTVLRPYGTPLQDLFHAEDFLMAQMDQGPLVGLETWWRKGSCPRCVQKMRAAGLGHLLLPDK